MKKKRVLYRLVVGETPGGFAQELELLAMDGWKPVGGTSSSPGFKGTVFAQLMTKEGA